MNGAVLPTADRVAQRALSFLKGLLGHYRPRRFSIKLWDGTCWEPECGHESKFTLVIKHPGSLRSMFCPPTELNLAEAYIFDDFDIEGDIEEVFPLAEFLKSRGWTLVDILSHGWQLLFLPSHRREPCSRRSASLRGRRHTIARDRQAIAYHYDVTSRFYALWLDPRMVYSCAYFHDEREALELAQERKLDYICRKLRLRQGDRLLDIGCGWGALVMHAARHYGVQALGITLSAPQAEFANECIKEHGLTGCCRVEVMDYREASSSPEFDKIVSIGMSEHVGEGLLPTYFQCAWDILKPGGVVLNQAIGNRPHDPVQARPFTNRYVFPDGELVPIGTLLRTAEAIGFEVRDVENLREHYYLTLHRWIERLRARQEAAIACTDEVTYRIWLLYLAGTAHGFKTGRLHLYQTLLCKPTTTKSGLPLTRADWYA